MKLVEFISSSDSTRRKSLKFGNQKINLHEALNPFSPHAKHPSPGAVDICFISTKPISEWIDRLKKNKTESTKINNPA